MVTMKQLFFTLIFTSLSLVSYTQLRPVTWDAQLVKGALDGLAEIRITANMEGKWHVYSQHLPSDEGPIPTTFAWEFPDGVNAMGDVKEPTPIKAYDHNFMMDVLYFGKKVVFSQTISFTPDAQGIIKLTVNFMTCDDEQCLPPKDVQLEIRL